MPRAGTPFRCTVQAPQSAMPQPYLVPVSWRSSRNTHSSGVLGAASTLRRLPLTRIEYLIRSPDQVASSANVLFCRAGGNGEKWPRARAARGDATRQPRDENAVDRVEREGDRCGGCTGPWSASGSRARWRIRRPGRSGLRRAPVRLDRVLRVMPCGLLRLPAPRWQSAARRGRPSDAHASRPVPPEGCVREAPRG